MLGSKPAIPLLIRVPISGPVKFLLAATVVLVGVLTSSNPANASEIPETLSSTDPVVVGEVGTDFPIDYLTVKWFASDVVMENHDEEGQEPFGAVRFLNDGAWGNWIAFVRDGAEAPGLWTSSLTPGYDAGAYEIRGLPLWASEPVATVINTTDGPASDATLSQAVDPLQNCLSRTEWGADESLRHENGDLEGDELWPPSFYPAQIVTVHHTADWNGTDDPAALVRATYYSHAIINGWGDIAYNYLIDEGGKVYEGRWSGTTSTPCGDDGDGSDFAHDSSGLLASGGHTAYHNQANIGIALLGLFADHSEFDFPPTIEPVGPTDEAVLALENVLVNLTTRHALDPVGTVDYYNPVWDTTDFAVNVISGHRDFRATACPGAFLYAQLPDIRQAVALRVDLPLIVVTIDPFIAQANGPGGYTGGIWGVKEGDPDSGPVALSNDAPSTFVFGDTTVTWTGTSEGGSVETATQTVRVVDTAPPELTLPDDIVEESTGNGAPVTFTTSAFDTVDQNVPVICSPVSGSVFQLGSTQVACSASDSADNVSSASFSVVVVDPDPFTDDDGSIFETDIAWMAAVGITKGCNPPSNTRFCPEARVTRGQMAAFLSRALGLTARLDNPFTDDDGSVFEADIERLAAAGITKGCNPPANTRFCPDSSVTREQMAAFLVRALGYSDNGGGDLFEDDDGSIFEADIDRLGTAGITKGCNPPSNTRFCPTHRVTRGQMAAFLHRALG